MNSYILILALASLALSCKISGFEMGVCMNNPLAVTSYCGPLIDNYVCIPHHNVREREHRQRGPHMTSITGI